MNKANIGWWEADLKAETYKCSELISQLLGIGEDGLISFEDFNKRILKEDQGYVTVSGKIPRAFWEKKFYGYSQIAM